ncbi:MAG: DUF1670 domain-containing protein [Syntrophobacteria bacterium]
MGRLKQHKFNIKQYVHSVEHKTKYCYLKKVNINRYGLCLAEAELLANIADSLYQNHLLDIPESHFQISVYDEFTSKKKSPLLKLSKKPVYIPAFCNFELELYSNRGLKALQNRRILNMLDSIAYQKAVIDINLLAKIVNITPKSIRERLAPFLRTGIKLPLTFLSNKWTTSQSSFRYSSALLNFFIENKSESDVMANLLISRSEWSNLLFHFFQFSYGDPVEFVPFGPVFDEISPLHADLIKSPRYREYSKLYPPLKLDKDSIQKDIFMAILRTYFSFSNALVSDYMNFLEREAEVANKQRLPGEIVYYAISKSVASGTPLSQSDTTPVKLLYWTADDLAPDSPYTTNTRKWNKALRYSIQAQNQKALLSQYDLAFLLGVSVAVIKNLMRNNDCVIVPTRGNIQDIGPGISHAETIIKLYLEGYTETEIKLKTTHSYESIENYLKGFTKVVGLTDMGFNPNQIRMTAKITTNLASKFLEIYKKYDTADYKWVLSMIRSRFHGKLKKSLHLGRK